MMSTARGLKGPINLRHNLWCLYDCLRKSMAVTKQCVLIIYLCFQVTQTDISIVFNLHDLHLVTSHLSTSRIGTMSRHRNETHLKGKS